MEEATATSELEAQATSSLDSRNKEGHSPIASDRRTEGGAKGAESADLSEDLSSEVDSDGGVDSLPEERRLELALEFKVTGNNLFKEGEYERALKSYKEGVSHVKRLTGSDAVSLSVQLNSNSCICCLRLEKWQEALKCANDVLSLEPRNVKALFRRAVALHNVGRLEEARESLLSLLNIDKNNVEARKELGLVKEKILKANKKDKQAYTNLFSRAGGLYEDREAEREERRRKEEEERRKRESEWKEEMQLRKDKGEAEVTFDEWMKQKKEDEDRKMREKQRELSQNTSTKSSKKQTSKSPRGGSEEMELDEEDKAIINETKKMGYCYFRRNLTEEEKRLNAQNLPVRINPDEALNHASQLQSGGSADGVSEGRSISQWNSKGTTYEEKDVSVWARDRFTQRLLEAEVCVTPSSNGSLSANSANSSDANAAMAALLKSCMKFKVKATKVEGVSGDVHLAVVRGTRRVFFELKCTVEFLMEAASSLPDVPGEHMESLLKGLSCKGTLKLPEVSSADGSGMDWLRGSTVKLDEKAEFRAFGSVTEEILTSFKECVAAKIQAFLDDCKTLS